MNIAFCYESVLPARGGCETYITDIARRLLSEGHQVHLYACKWDAEALPKGMVTHQLPRVRGARFLRPWRFGALCEEATRHGGHDVTVGFNKTWGQDVLYPQGGLHAATADHNLKKYRSPWMRSVAALAKLLDPAHQSFSRLERKQYLTDPRPTIVVNSYMVQRHFEEYYGIPPEDLFVVRSAIDPARFVEKNRPRIREKCRRNWGVPAEKTVGLIAAMNYRLKGLEPLLYAVKCLHDVPDYRSVADSFCLLVVGHPKYRRYEKLAQSLGISEHVRFVGYCPEMRNGYFAADFLIHPTFYDPCSLVVLEAFACSLPVITTRYNGASELMRPLQEGYVVDDPHDHHHLAWSIAQLLDPVRLKHCAAAARKSAMAWTFDHHYRALLQVFQQAAARRPLAA